MLGAGGGDPLQLDQASKQTGRRAAEQAVEQPSKQPSKQRDIKTTSLQRGARSAVGTTEDATDKERSRVEERSTQL